MENKELNNVLRDRARELGLCDQWYKEWDKESTRQELIHKYLKGIDFCIEHDYPKIDFIKSYFPNKQLLENGIFVDEDIDVRNIGMAVLLGETKGKIFVDGLTSSNIYVRHKSNLEVIATDGARVFIECYEQCHVRVFADDTSRVFVYWHGGEIEDSGRVVVRDKRKAGD